MKRFLLLAATAAQPILLAKGTASGHSWDTEDQSMGCDYEEEAVLLGVVQQSLLQTQAQLHLLPPQEHAEDLGHQQMVQAAGYANYSLFQRGMELIPRNSSTAHVVQKQVSSDLEEEASARLVPLWLPLPREQRESAIPPSAPIVSATLMEPRTTVAPEPLPPPRWATRHTPHPEPLPQGLRWASQTALEPMLQKVIVKVRRFIEVAGICRGSGPFADCNFASTLSQDLPVLAPFILVAVLALALALTGRIRGSKEDLSRLELNVRREQMAMWATVPAPPRRPGCGWGGLQALAAAATGSSFEMHLPVSARDMN